MIRRIAERFPTVDASPPTGGRDACAPHAGAARLLVRAGLTRVHLGLESGADAVLMAVDKGCSSGELIAAGENVVRAGLELCFYLMPGLGGRAAAAAHVAGSARVIRAVAAAAPAERPLVVRLRTAAVVPGTPLAEREAAGGFVLPDDVEVAEELRDLLVSLGDARLELRSDHTLNLLPALGRQSAGRPRAPHRDARRVPGLAREEQAPLAVGARLGIFAAWPTRLDPARSAALDRQLGAARRCRRRRAPRGRRRPARPLPLDRARRPRRRARRPPGPAGRRAASLRRVRRQAQPPPGRDRP